MIGESDYGQTAQAFSEDQYSLSERLFVQFYIHPKHNQSKSLAEGRPIFDDTEYIRVITPGDKDNIVERPARKEDMMRFRAQYAAFKDGREQMTTGTPLKMWPAVSPAQVAELAFFKVFTVEALAEMSDSNAMNFMGIQVLKQKAKDFVAATKDAAPVAAMNAALEERDTRIAQLESQIKELCARMDAPESDE